MSALSYIRNYLKTHFAGHDVETLMEQFEAAIEGKVEAAVSDLKQEIAELRSELAPEQPDPKAITLMPAGSTTELPPEKIEEIEAMPAIAQPMARVEAAEEIK